MNYIRHLTGFFDRAAKDYRLNSTHISLYMAIFQMWNVNRFKNPISLTRSEAMELSKVGSQTTYHKCMKELHLYGYLRYDPSYHPLRGSWVYLFEFERIDDENMSSICRSAEHLLDKQDITAEHDKDMISFETCSGKEVQSPLNIYKHSKHIKLSFLEKNKNAEKKENYNNAMLESKSSVDRSTVEEKILGNCFSGTTTDIVKVPAKIDKNDFELIPQKVETVIEFFLASAYSEIQAIKFFYYFCATGWKLGGKAKIEDWHAAAHSWVLNADNSGSHGKSKRREPVANRLHSKSEKNYSEPL